MKLTIKILKGDEYNVETSEESTILDIKQDLERKSMIPVEHQKLLLVGKTLSDEKTVASYGTIKDGTKLTLVVKKPDPLREVILRQFKKYLQEEQSQRLTNEFMKDFDSKIQQLSLDDLEKIASDILAKKGQNV
ncbi:ubiquitin-like protein 4A [Toxorhynchites rutilus septentrionalis]|uniref:ubiquitin-like protein 4A n=1 Tax=Toxorhynchites rutilus septentrionalis TaxID=329112 RepID=UPI0024791C96|nr:ubiquitin-like protein 4A [Toxorhynchites rutilus septentrionalis]